MVPYGTGGNSQYGEIEYMSHAQNTKHPSSSGIGGHGKREKFLILENKLFWEIPHFPIIGNFMFSQSIIVISFAKKIELINIFVKDFLAM